MRTYAPDAVTTAFAANGQGPMVYGKYKDHGYAVNPLTAQLGTLTPEGVSASQAFEIAGLNWTAEKRDVYFAGATGPVRSPEHCSIVRSDTDACLGIHGAGYTPVQNSALINLLDYLREDIKLESVLAIRGGRKIFASASINTEGEVVPGDRVRRYIHLFNSHDGSSSFGCFFSDVRLACANQLAYLTGREAGRAESAGTGLRRKHTSSVTAYAEALPQLINLERRTFAQSLDQLRALTKVKLTPEIARRILEATYQDKLATPIRDKDTDKKRPRDLADLSELPMIWKHYAGGTGFGIDPNARNAYTLFNAISQYETHDSGRAKNELDRVRARLESLYGGLSAKRIDRAREACLALV
jgi:phage/plasmid-like protein (TIGR03299 family)